MCTLVVLVLLAGCGDHVGLDRVGFRLTVG
jgi:hypothetical protein